MKPRIRIPVAKPGHAIASDHDYDRRQNRKAIDQELDEGASIMDETETQIMYVERAETKDKEYMGDGCYAKHDGYHIVLTTEDGISVQNEIYLEPPVLRAVIRYATEHGYYGTTDLR